MWLFDLYIMNTTSALQIVFLSAVVQKQVTIKYLAFLSESQYISPLGTKSPGRPDYTQKPFSRSSLAPKGQLTELWSSWEVNVGFVFCTDGTRGSPRSSRHSPTLPLQWKWTLHPHSQGGVGSSVEGTGRREEERYGTRTICWGGSGFPPLRMRHLALFELNTQHPLQPLHPWIGSSASDGLSSVNSTVTGTTRLTNQMTFTGFTSRVCLAISASAAQDPISWLTAWSPQQEQHLRTPPRHRHTPAGLGFYWSFPTQVIYTSFPNTPFYSWRFTWMKTFF